MLSKKEIKRFYIGASHIGAAIANGRNDLHTRSTFGDAVEHAKEKLEEDSRLDTIIIVKIVGIVRRRELPVVVERL